MTNGDTVEPEVEAFFVPIAATLEAFAARHHLKIDRYVRGNPSWDFSFRLLDGGQAIIQVLFVGGHKVLVAGSREIRDYATFRRSTCRWVRGDKCQHDPNLSSELRSLLQEIMALPADELAPDGRDYTTLWRGLCTESLAYINSLPLPAVE